ncbi:MAG: sodium:solute symporter family protein [Ignavibacteriaceae bacterium]|nr:sodium:solute symporter family protein [Ignavibacteriaceae bacterium]
MVSFNILYFIVLILFFVSVLSIGFFSGRKSRNDAEGYLLSSRNVGLILFILTNVATWYGGILGVGEFVYRYGIVSWVTQGFPYYVFAFLFAVFLAGKIRNASLFTIPDKLSSVYGRQVGLVSAVLVFVLVSPAPYLLMTGNLLSLVFNVDILIGLILGFMLSAAYLIKGGYRSDLYTDVLQFFIMFIGFIIIVVFCFSSLGNFEFIKNNLPSAHLNPTGGVSVEFLIVWFLIALWTFADPGFHQRCYAAKNGNVAVKGIIISIVFMFLFDALTTLTGLYARAYLPNLSNPTLSYPLLAEAILPSGIKGIFYAALFATIMSTLNSFLFLSAATISRDFFFRFSSKQDLSKLKNFTIYGLIISGILSILLAYLMPSVIEIWYTIGSICIPGIIIPVISSYYPKFKISEKLLLFEMIASVSAGFSWFIFRQLLEINNYIKSIEPMIVGLTLSIIIHAFGILNNRI